MREGQGKGEKQRTKGKRQKGEGKGIRTEDTGGRIQVKQEHGVRNPNREWIFAADEFR